MKRGYIRLLIFCIIILFLLLINTFVINILSSYKLVLFLLLLLIIFNHVFVIEKNKHLYFKDILFEIFLFTLTFFILYYLSGLFIGLARTHNYMKWVSIKNIIIPLILTIILKEIFRYNLLSKADGNKICTYVVILLFVLLDITNYYFYTNFKSQYDVLKFISLYFIPSISKNISYSYITRKVGYKPIIVFDLIFSLYLYFLPIVPDINEYITSIIYLLIPILFSFRISMFIENRENNKIPSNYNKIRINGALISMPLIIVMIYFYSGYFRFYLVAVATGSMTPNINKGDLALVDQKYDYNNIEIGDVLAVKKSNVIIVHRIVKKIKIGDTYYYYTKGDANSHMDDFVIQEDMVVGKVRHKISYVGYPTVWFNSM